MNDRQGRIESMREIGSRSSMRRALNSRNRSSRRPCDHLVVGKVESGLPLLLLLDTMLPWWNGLRLAATRWENMPNETTGRRFQMTLMM